MSYKTIEVAPSVQGTVYHSGDAITALIEFKDVCTPYSNSFEIVSAIITDLGKQSAKLWLVLFDRTFTETAKHAAFAPSDVDILNIIGVILFEDYLDFNDSSVGMAGEEYRKFSFPGNLVEGGTSLFGQLVCESTPDYVSTGDITIKLTVRR